MSDSGAPRAARTSPHDDSPLRGPLAARASCRALLGAFATLVAACARPAEPVPTPGALDAAAALGAASSAPVTPATPPSSDAGFAPSPAPALDLRDADGMIAEPARDVAVDDAWGTDLALDADGCVRVSFAATAPVAASLGEASLSPRVSGTLPPRGTACERAGHALRLGFAGRANVRYAVLRVAP